jgi:hypothetical protein
MIPDSDASNTTTTEKREKENKMKDRESRIENLLMTKRAIKSQNLRVL